MATRLDPDSPGTGFAPVVSRAGKMRLPQLARMCHNVGSSLHAGVDIRRVWATEAQRGSQSQRVAMEKIRDRVGNGDTLAEAMLASGGYFPLLVCEMVDVGERSGRLERVFFRLSEHYDNVIRMRRTFLTGIAWPIIELTLALVVIGLFILILGITNQGDGPPPITFFGLYGTRGFMIYAGVLLGIASTIGFVVFAVSKEWFNLDPLLVLSMKIPGLGQIFQTMAMSRLIWSFSMVTDTEIEPARSVELAVRTSQHPYYTSHISAMKSSIAKGDSILDAFQGAGVFPDDFLDTLETGEISGRISEAMEVLAKEYESRAKAHLKTLTVVAGVAVGLFAAGLIIFMIFNLAMQYIGILNDNLP